MQLPAPFVERLHTQFPDRWSSLLDAYAQPVPVSLRINPRKIQLQLPADQVPWCADGLYLPERPSFTLDPWLHAGAYYVQEASSMLVAHAVRHFFPEHTPLTALDLCAAPGGKSTLISSLLPQGSLLLANEVIPARANILAENLLKWGDGQSIVSRSDPRDFQQLPEFFDLILADAPCSGEGLFRKDPDSANEWSEAHLHLCAERQKRILMDVWDSLKPGGMLIYSTCTLNPEENEQNVAWFMRQTGAVSLPIPVPEPWGIETITAGPVYALRCLPLLVRGEGFFLAALQKPGTPQVRKAPKREKTGLLPASKTEMASLRPWLRDPDAWAGIKVENSLHLLPATAMAEAELLASRLRVHTLGTPVAEITRKDLRPLPELALFSGLRQDAFPRYEAPLKQAVSYLRRDIFTPEGPEGWMIVTFGGIPLGWVKQMGNRANNYFPQEWRIRMNPPQGEDWGWRMQMAAVPSFDTPRRLGYSG